MAKPPQSVLPAAQAAYLLNAAGKTKEADKAFGQLRELGQAVDLSAFVFSRLAPIAERLGLPEDWRPELKPNPDDSPEHPFPDLDTLGPFRWKPASALPWKLPDSTGKRLSLADYRGRPVVVVFYLGFGCLHCVEQLQAIAPKMDAFREAGLEIVAVSTESQSELAQALESYEKEATPFPFLLSPIPSSPPSGLTGPTTISKKHPSTGPSSSMPPAAFAGRASVTNPSRKSTFSSRRPRDSSPTIPHGRSSAPSEEERIFCTLQCLEQSARSLIERIDRPKGNGEICWMKLFQRIVFLVAFYPVRLLGAKPLEVASHGSCPRRHLGESEQRVAWLSRVFSRYGGQRSNRTGSGAWVRILTDAFRTLDSKNKNYFLIGS